MNQIIFNKSIFIICGSLVLSACNSYPHQYSTYDTLTGIIAPAGQYSEWYTDSKSDISGSRDIYSQKNCTQNEEWTDPTTVDKFCPHDEARSKASGLTPPSPVIEHFNVIEDIGPGQISGFIDAFSDTFFFQ